MEVLTFFFFFKDHPNFSPSSGTGENLPTRPEVSVKIKNVNLIKIAKKRNGPKRNCHTSFFVFRLLNSKVVPVDSELNSALENQIDFCQGFGCGNQKSSQT